MVMEGPLLMESYEDVFEEIASKFYSDEPITKGLPIPNAGSVSFSMTTRFSTRLRQGSGVPMSFHPPPHYLMDRDPGLLMNSGLLTNGNVSPGNSNASLSKSNENPDNETWTESNETLSWTDSKVAKYNANSKMFKCVDCDTVGFLSRIAEHWLGTHANLKVFRCPRCPYSSAWARCVRMHLTRHHNEQHSDAALWKDNQALEEVTRLLQNLKNRMENKGDGTVSVEPVSDKRYACPHCPYATDRRDLYTRHENIHKDDKPFHCYVCYKMFSRADHVKKHFFRMHKDQPYDINLIRRHPPKPSSNLGMPTFYNNLDNNIPSHNSPNHGHDMSHNHTLNHDQDSNQDEQSPDSMDEKYNKKRRLPKMFVCTYCSWRGVDNWCLKRHLNTHIKPYLCVLCDYKAARAERLSTHVLKIHNKRICNKCNFLAEDQAQLNLHIQESHSGHERGQIRCEECPETFDGHSELETHSILVHNKDLLDCEMCDFKTTHQGSLDRHRLERHGNDNCNVNDVLARNNTSRKEIRCRECGCEFANHASLQTHYLLLHRSERIFPRLPYTCSLCQYSCASQMNMMEHMRVHTGEVLQCRAEDCSFRTPFDSVLREHVHYVHNDDFIIRCPHCGYAVSTRQALARHFPYHHPKLCSLCLAVIRKHFPGCDPFTDFTVQEANGLSVGSSRCSVNGEVKLPNNAGEMGDNSENQSANLSSLSLSSQVELQVITQVKRSRKQSKPRKVVRTDDSVYDSEEDLLKHQCFHQKHKYHKLIKKFAYIQQRRCRLCHCAIAFNLQKNLLLHMRWHHNRKIFTCEHCDKTYKHQYQVLLHASRAHVSKKL